MVNFINRYLEEKLRDACIVFKKIVPSRENGAGCLLIFCQSITETWVKQLMMLQFVLHKTIEPCFKIWRFD